MIPYAEFHASRAINVENRGRSSLNIRRIMALPAEIFTKI